MIVPIKTIHDLRNEIVRLETLNVQQEAAIKQRFSSPKTIYRTILSIFPKPVEGSGGKTKQGNPFGDDIVALAAKFLLPFTLNKTLFKGSGFITRSIVTFLSQKASGLINQDSVNSSWDKFKTALSKVKLPELKDLKTKRVYKTPKSNLPAVINNPK